MPTRTLAVLALAASLGCFPFSAPFHLYPLGAGGSPDPVPCRFKIHFGWRTATLTATLPGGEVFTGSFPLDTRAPDRTLAPQWDQVFGAGYFQAKVLGSARHLRVTLASHRGGTLILELHAIPGDPHGGMEGVAVDAGQGLYKAGY